MENFLLNKLLDDFNSGIKNRTTFFLQFYSSEKILAWHFETWEKDYIALKDSRNIPNGLEVWSKYSQAHNTVNSIFNHIHKKILLEGGTYAHHFYSKLAEHAEKYKDKNIIINDKLHHYLEDLIFQFSKVFFENVGKTENHFDIWEHYFPVGWRISSDVSETSSIVQLTLLKEYINWAKERIREPKEDFDGTLDDVSKNLFPDVDPRKWAHILIFALNPAGIDNRVKDVIYRKWTFGYIGRIRSYVGNSEDAENELERITVSLDDSETVNTYKLTLRISFLQQIFTKERLDRFISESESLNFETSSIEESKRLNLLTVFKGLKKYLESVE